MSDTHQPAVTPMPCIYALQKTMSAGGKCAGSLKPWLYFVYL